MFTDYIAMLIKMVRESFLTQRLFLKGYTPLKIAEMPLSEAINVN